jgi:hypothetical protein
MARRQGKTSPFSGANIGAASPATPGQTQNAKNRPKHPPKQRHKKAARKRHHS